MPTVSRSMAAGAAVVVTAAWRRLKRRRRKNTDNRARESPAATGAGASQTGPSLALADSRTMTKTNSRAISPSIPDESTDDRPQLVAHDVSNVHDGPLVAFYDPEGETLGGEIIYARATVNVGDWR